jgi:hypothetical protein
MMRRQFTRSKRPPSSSIAIQAVVISLTASCGLWLAAHYPLAPIWAIGAFLVVAVTAGLAPLLILAWLPACVAVVGFAPWTGWITFEEFDMLVLAMAAGGYSGMLWRYLTRPNKTSTTTHDRRAIGYWIALGLFAGSTLWSMKRGFADAGGFSFGWFQGYHEPMNSVRLAKSLFLAMLLLPLWQQLQAAVQPDRAERALSFGMATGLSAAALAVMWERAAFTDLLNFSADYRTSGLFWEMHVGGAALDGFLALTMPFAVRELLRARSTWKWSIAAAMTAAGAYACLTTFSRGVYLAIPVGLVVMLVLGKLQSRRTRLVGQSGPPPTHGATLKLMELLPVAAFGVGVAMMFPTSGYRGAIALLAVFALMLPLAAMLRPLAAGVWSTGTVAGLLAGIAFAGVAQFVYKGPYVFFGLSMAFACAMVLAHRLRRVSPRIALPMALAGFVTSLVALVLVASHWGGTPAVWPAATMAFVGYLMLLAAIATRQPWWPGSTRHQAGMISVMVLFFAITAVFGGGDYMGSRFATGGSDLSGRFIHWKQGASMLIGQGDWYLGKGTGRFPANYFLIGDPAAHPGDYRLQRDGDSRYVRLTGGLHTNGWGEVFRLSQRVEAPGLLPKLRVRVRTSADVTLHFEVCEKHLIYNAACLIRPVNLKASPGKWQSIEVELGGASVQRGPWYAPKLIAFSVAMSTLGGQADLDNISLIRNDGRELLSNGDFEDELAHWFFSSDRNHLPWHIKSVFMHVLFDQGIVGLVLWSLLLAGALARLTIGRTKAHPLAPAVVASLVGFATVGLFDSLLDVPRVATLYYWMLGVALTLQIPPRAALQRG